MKQKIIANRDLGQNFLTDRKVLQKIADIVLAEDQNVIEIGPGTGNLSRILAKKKLKSLTLIEKDKRFILPLQEEFFGANVLNKDCFDCNLTTDLLIGNLPYNITNRFLFHLFEQVKIKESYLMLQKEVAEKITAPVGSKHFGFLTLIMNLVFNLEILFIVPPSAFYPRPSVFSAFVKIVPNGRELTNEQKTQSIVLAKLIFQHKNKKLKNILKNCPEEISEKRANNLSAEHFLACVY